MPEALIGRDLTFARGEREVLRGVNVAVTRGRVGAVVGPNGGGKTTLLWLLAGLLTPSGGQVLLADDRAADGDSSRDGERPARFPLAGLGMVFQEPALWDHLTAEEHLRLVLAGKGLSRSVRRERLAATLDELGLGPLRTRRPARMSGGERQRLAVARALVLRPKWLLLDEPLAHLDGSARQELLELLRGAIAPTHAGVLMTTHEPDEALRLADDALVLLGGEAVQSGPAMEVYRHPVNLAAALTLGAACEVRGEAKGGALLLGDGSRVDGIDPGLAGPATLLLRPEDLEFLPGAEGRAAVARCEWLAGRYRLTLHLAGMSLLAYSPAPVPAGQKGRLRCRLAATGR